MRWLIIILAAILPASVLLAGQTSLVVNGPISNALISIESRFIFQASDTLIADGKLLVRGKEYQFVQGHSGKDAR